MADVTAAMVKELRERTGAGMMECKKALVEANGDMETAEDIIAKSGHKKAAKSASRTAAEGRIVIASNPQNAAVVEINCETDFVARDENFVQFAQQIAEKVLATGIVDADKLLEASMDGKTIEDARKNLITRLGENIQIRRMKVMNAQTSQRIGQYVHNSRIGTLVLVEGGDDALAKDLAMHVAAMKPQFVSQDEVPAKTIAKEKEIMMERAKQSGKPENILEKIVEGQLQKHLNEHCLIGQPFFKDPDQTVTQLLKSKNAKVLQMIRFEVGEGIEVIKKSFEEEVAQARGSNS
ncbi:MAG: elongation factor Ts [Gammaproteobacteria bacterium]|jgi:elongation factor Ts|nr:elongation factor Ts [Gammaproteobacteria bacterium]